MKDTKLHHIESDHFSLDIYTQHYNNKIYYVITNSRYDVMKQKLVTQRFTILDADLEEFNCLLRKAVLFPKHFITKMSSISAMKP
jgi:hypothetical protein